MDYSKPICVLSPTNGTLWPYKLAQCVITKATRRNITLR